MHRKILNDMHRLTGLALDALAKGDVLTARRWLRTMQHDTSPEHLAALEQLLTFQHANSDLLNIDMALAEAKGVVIEGAYTKGAVL